MISWSGNKVPKSDAAAVHWGLGNNWKPPPSVCGVEGTKITKDAACSNLSPKDDSGTRNAVLFLPYNGEPLANSIQFLIHILPPTDKWIKKHNKNLIVNIRELIEGLFLTPSPVNSKRGIAYPPISPKLTEDDNTSTPFGMPVVKSQGEILRTIAHTRWNARGNAKSTASYSLKEGELLLAVFGNTLEDDNALQHVELLACFDKGIDNLELHWSVVSVSGDWLQPTTIPFVPLENVDDDSNANNDNKCIAVSIDPYVIKTKLAITKPDIRFPPDNIKLKFVLRHSKGWLKQNVNNRKKDFEVSLPFLPKESQEQVDNVVKEALAKELALKQKSKSKRQLERHISKESSFIDDHEEESEQPIPFQNVLDEFSVYQNVKAEQQFMEEQENDIDESISDSDLSSPSSSTSKIETFKVGDFDGVVYVQSNLSPDGGEYNVEICAALPFNAVLHWGLYMGRQNWKCPPPNLRTEDTEVVDAVRAVQTPLLSHGLLQGITLNIPVDPNAPKKNTPICAGVAFVFKSVKGDKWVKQSIGDKDCVFRFHNDDIWQGPAGKMVENLVEAECEWMAITLMHRYNLCHDFISQWEKERQGQGSDLEKYDLDFWSWMFVWQRFSFQRLLDWQRCYNTKPKDLAYATERLSCKLSSTFLQHANLKPFVRMTLSSIGRGGNQGQRIRDEILHIMHRNHISERAGHFFEQWHQKLHNNTTPDDVGICKALLAFLRSNGDLSTYWRVLQENGITKERLAAYDRPITTEPYLISDTNTLIREFSEYQSVLQSVHDAADLKVASDHARHAIDHGLQQQLDGLLHASEHRINNLDEAHNRFCQIQNIRSALLQKLSNTSLDVNCARDILFLDLALETQQVVIIQGHNENRLPNLCDQITSLIYMLAGHDPSRSELQAVLADWQELSPRLKDCNCAGFGRKEEVGLMLQALTERVERLVGDFVNEYQNLIGLKSNYLGKHLNTPRQVLDCFVDEVVRGSSWFSLGQALKRLGPILRNIAHLPPWQIISNVPIVEDILSHCAVRARNSHVVLAVCFDPPILQNVEDGMLGKWVRVKCRSDGTAVEIEEAENSRPGTEVAKSASRMLSRKLSQSILQEKSGNSPVPTPSTPCNMFGGPPSRCNSESILTTPRAKFNLENDLDAKWILSSTDFEKGLVGGKSLNLHSLSQFTEGKGKVNYKIPSAMALPYGVLQKILADKSNAVLLKELKKHFTKLPHDATNAIAGSVFKHARSTIRELSLPKELEKELVKQGKNVSNDKLNVDESWTAIKEVYASMFALRPWVSLRKAERSYHDLNMAILVQQLFPAEYAFVLHTRNPFNEKEEVYGEVVCGLGETLVGNAPGRALSFSGREQDDHVVVHSFPSKSFSLYSTLTKILNGNVKKSFRCNIFFLCARFGQDALIFRSDSNGEDLDGFAGAGLFESIPTVPAKNELMRYNNVKLVTDNSFRQDLLKKLVAVGSSIERSFDGVPQDVEGLILQSGQIVIVQSRPQV